MRLLVLALFSTNVVASVGPIAIRDIKTITGVMSTVSANIVALDNSVKAFNGEIASVKAAADTVVSSIKNGKSKIDASAGLSLGDALDLKAPVQDMAAKGQTLLDNLKIKKNTIEQGNFCTTVRLEVTDINTYSNALIDSTISKVPGIGQGIARSIAQPLIDVLKASQDEFGEANCKDDGTTPSATSISLAGGSSAASSSSSDGIRSSASTASLAATSDGSSAAIRSTSGSVRTVLASSEPTCSSPTSSSSLSESSNPTFEITKTEIGTTTVLCEAETASRLASVLKITSISNFEATTVPCVTKGITEAVKPQSSAGISPQTDCQDRSHGNSGVTCSASGIESIGNGTDAKTGNGNDRAETDGISNNLQPDGGSGGNAQPSDGLRGGSIYCKGPGCIVATAAATVNNCPTIIAVMVAAAAIAAF